MPQPSWSPYGKSHIKQFLPRGSPQNKNDPALKGKDYREDVAKMIEKPTRKDEYTKWDKKTYNQFNNKLKQNLNEVPTF